MMPEGLYIEESPALPLGYQIRCLGCRCSVAIDHQPFGPDCEEARRERDASRSE